MKTNPFILLLLLLPGLISCGSHKTWYKEGNIGSSVWGTNRKNVRFYFINKEGHDLIVPGKRETYPVSYHSGIEATVRNWDRNAVQHKVYPDGTIEINDEKINVDPQEKLHYVPMWVYGDGRQTFPTLFYTPDGSVDTLRITYRYTTDCIGGSYCGDITAARYNGVDLKYSDEKSDREERKYNRRFDKKQSKHPRQKLKYDFVYRKVFIMKADGQTGVFLQRPSKH